MLFTLVMLISLPFVLLFTCTQCFGNFSQQAHALTLSTIQQCEMTLPESPYPINYPANDFSRDDFIIKDDESGFFCVCVWLLHIFY